MHFHFCNVTWNETWNVPMFGADNIASLTDSCPRNINIKHRKSVSLSISAFTNTASHQAVVACFVSKMYISEANLYCDRRQYREILRLTQTGQRALQVFAPPPPIIGLRYSRWYVGPSERKTSKTSFGDVIRWWEMALKSKYYALGCLHVKGLYKRGLERASEYLLVSSQFVHWDSKIKQYLV